MQKKIFRTLLSALFFLGVLVPIFSEKNPNTPKPPVPKKKLPIAEQRKFDSYFYDALNAKAQGKFGESFDFLQHCFAIDSTNASLLAELGSFYGVLQENRKALTFYKNAVKYDPDNYYYNMMLASVSKSLDLKEDVIDIYQSLLQKYPQKVELNMQLAEAYNDSGELQKAIDALNAIEKTEGISETLTMNKYRLYTMLDNKKKAFEEIEHIIEKNPDDLRYVLLLGDLYLQDGQYDNALKYYKEVQQMDADFPALVLSMANYYERTNNKAAAEAEFRKVLTSPQMDVDVKLQLLTRYIGILQETEQELESVNPLFRTLFDQHPHHPQLNYLYGNVLMIQGDKSEAMKQFEIFTKANPENPLGWEQMLRVVVPDSIDKIAEITTKALKYNPGVPQFYFYLGAAKYQQKKYKEALAIFEEGVLKTEGKNPAIKSDFYGQIGDLHYFLGNKEIAYENYEKALKLNPQNLVVLNNYSYYMSLEKKNLDKAEQMSSITVKAEPSNATYLDTYGWVLFQQGAYTAAKIYIENAIKNSENNTPSSEVLEHYGDVLYKTGEHEKALEKWKEAKAAGNSDSKALDQKIETRKYIEPK